MVWIQALAWELLHVAGMVKKKNVSFQYLPRARHCSRSEGGSNNKEILPPVELTVRGWGQPWARDLSSSSFLICEVGIAMYLVHWIQWVRYRETTHQGAWCLAGI